jgi:integrase
MKSDRTDCAGSFSPVPFAQFTREVLKLYQEPQKRPGTLRKVSQVLREVSRFCSSTADLGPLAICDWMASFPDRSPHTWHSLLATLQAACSWMSFRGYAPNPFDFRSVSRWIPSDELGEIDPFRYHRTAEEIGRVLHQADLEAQGGDWHAMRLQACVYSWAYTGAGLLEVLGLRIGDVDLAARQIQVKSHPKRKLKTGARAARLPIADALAVVLKGWIPQCGCDWLIPGTRRESFWNQASPGYRPTDRVRQLGERAGVNDVTPLTFRHSFGTLAEDWGIGELMLQRILRHSTPRTQRHYRHHDAELLARAAAKVHFTVPPPCDSKPASAGTCS